MAKPIIIYHANCMDGICAAAVAAKKYPDALFVYMQYGQDLMQTLGKALKLESSPEKVLKEIANCSVYMLDFSVPPEVAIVFSRNVYSLTILDHHESAVKKWDNIFVPNTQTIFDTAKSGAMLAWEYFFGGPPPFVVTYVQDRDLWLWKQSNSKEVSLFLQTLDKNVFIWKDLLDGVVAHNIMVEQGACILRYENQLIEAAFRNAIPAVINGFRALVVNSANLQSELGNRILEPNTDPTPIQLAAAFYYDLKIKKFVWSFRSKNGEAIKVAEKLGGGGHPNAAGAKTDSMEIWS